MQVIHLDLKPDNILITDTNKALLIDFGLGRPFKNLYDMEESDYILSYDYTWYAPEFKVFYNLMDEDEDSSFLERLISKTYRNYEDEELFDKHSVKKGLKSFISKLGKDLLSWPTIPGPEYDTSSSQIFTAKTFQTKF